MMMLKSLYLRLGIVLLSLFALLAVALLLTLSQLSGKYLDEQAQSTQGMLAEYIAKEHHTIGGAVIDISSMASLFSYVSIINPLTEAYLLDTDGNILAQSHVKRQLLIKRIDLTPIYAYLNKSQPLPIMGDDPHEMQRHRIFSVAPIEYKERRLGYVYIVLSSSNPLSFQELWTGSQNFQIASLLVFSCMIFAFITGLILFRYLTNRLRILTQSVEDFRERQYTEDLHIPPFKKGGDEIDRLTEAFAQMSHRIIKQIKRLEQIDHERRTSITNASHDLRTPLTAMQGYLETLLLKDERLAPLQRKRYIEIAYKHSIRLQDLVNEMFDLARLDSTDLASQPEFFALDELSIDVIQKFQLMADQKSITLTTIANLQPCFVWADLGMIERVYENLLNNAIRHTPVGGKISITLTANEQLVLVEVKDNGEGIDIDIIDTVFERYIYSQHKESAQKRTGIGLAIVKRIMELHQTTIQLESTLGKGATFRFELSRTPHVRHT